MSLSYYNSSTNNLIPIAGSASSTLNEMRSTIDDVVYNQADAFDDTVAYKVGAIVVYNDVTYKCIADTTAGTLPTNTTYWARASLGDIIANFKATEVYMGTAAGWNALSSEAKAEYSLVCFTDEGEALIQASDVAYDQSNVEDELDDLKSDVDTLFSNLTSSAKTEDDVTATKTHSNGDYFELGGVFVRATANIAIGDSLIEGTNYVSTNIGTELSSMKTSFQVGCNTIVSAVTAKGQTPTSNNPTDIATAISNISPADHEYVEFSSLSDSDLADLPIGVTYYGTDIDINDTESKTVGDYKYEYTHKHIYTCSVKKTEGPTIPEILNQYGTKSNPIPEETFLNSISTEECFTDNYASQCVGKFVSLTHSTKNVPWIIIGYNHDGTTYTFDLWSSVSMYDSQTFGSSQTYSSSTVRTTINNMVTGFSSAVQGRLQIMSVSSNGSTLNDKVKLLSLTEMGISSGSEHPGVEGSAYSNYFTTERRVGGPYSDLIGYNSSNSAVPYWTRSRNTNGTSYVYIISNNGYATGNLYSASYSLLPVIRIGVA